MVALRRDDSGNGAVFRPTARFTTRAELVVTAEHTSGTPGAGTFFRLRQQLAVQYSARKPPFFAIADYDVAALLRFFLARYWYAGHFIGGISPRSARPGYIRFKQKIKQLS